MHLYLQRRHLKESRIKKIYTNICMKYLKFIAPFSNIPLLYIKYLATHRRQSHAGAMRKLWYDLCVCKGDNPLAQARGLSSHTTVQCDTSSASFALFYLKIKCIQPRTFRTLYFLGDPHPTPAPSKKYIFIHFF